MRFELHTKVHPILVNINYRSELQSHTLYWQFFDLMLNKALDENSHIICFGDLNNVVMVNLPTTINDIDAVNGLFKIINKPTHVDKHASNISLLDPILITDSIQAIDSYAIEIDRKISDHDVTYVTIKYGFSNQKTYQRTVWDYKKGDYTLMKQQIIDKNWEKLINDELDVNNAC
jgi:hypothetical protein